MKVFLILILIVAVVILGWLFLKSPAPVAVQNPTPVPVTTEPTAIIEPTVTAPPKTTNTPTKTPQNIVTYTDSGYSPSALTIKKGDTVVWENKSSGPMWTASNPHPIHTGYPVGGGCISSAFDECHGGAPGSSWTFKFDKAGTWGYHNHLNFGDGGTIVVQ